MAEQTKAQLTGKEFMITTMALQTLIENLKDTKSNPLIPLNPMARKEISDMLSNAQSALEKIEKASGVPITPLGEYQEGDENEFLTKES